MTAVVVLCAILVANYLFTRWDSKCMEEAKRLMDVTSKSFWEIAACLGYSSQSYFQKAFKKTWNMTPGEYRAGHSGKSTASP